MYFSSISKARVRSKMRIFAVALCLTVQLCVSFASDAHFLSDEYIDGINSQQDLWRAGRNFDPNTPLSEIQVLMGAIMEGREDKRSFVKTFDPLWPDQKKIPKRFDARKKWHKKCPRIAQILDQGRCGSCWAISAAQAFTDRYCIKTRGKHQMRLSTANVLSCCNNCGFGCSGGWESLAWAYFSTHGLPSGGNYNTSEGCQPYSIQSPCNYNDGSPYEKCPSSRGTPDCYETCTNSEYRKTLKKDYRYVKKEYSLPANEEAIMRDIMAHGPVTTAFKVMGDFMSYKSGVYEPANGTQPIGGHAAKLIGWGVEKRVPYWLIMNSWNEYWGDHGLIKMKRNSPKIKLEHECWGAEARLKRKEDYEEEGEIEEDESDMSAEQDGEGEEGQEEEED